MDEHSIFFLSVKHLYVTPNRHTQARKREKRDSTVVQSLQTPPKPQEPPPSEQQGGWKL